jgi:hypothetical protein
VAAAALPPSAERLEARAFAVALIPRNPARALAPRLSPALWTSMYPWPQYVCALVIGRHTFWVISRVKAPHRREKRSRFAST